jgi:hypothetical protein
VIAWRIARAAGLVGVVGACGILGFGLVLELLQGASVVAGFGGMVLGSCVGFAAWSYRRIGGVALYLLMLLLGWTGIIILVPFFLTTEPLQTRVDAAIPGACCILACIASGALAAHLLRRD